MDIFWESLRSLADPTTVFVIAISSLYGLFVGSIPGLTATMAVALWVPIAFWLNPIPALAAIVALQAMAIFAGDIPAALVRIPGTPATAAYTADSYALSRAGQARLVLGVDVVASALGGVMGTVVLIVGAGLLIELATKFSSFEYFWLAVLGLSTAAFIASGTPLKGLVSVLLGLLLATIGIDITLGFPRFTFGNENLLGGINFIPAMIGLFGLAEVLRNVLGGRLHMPLGLQERGPMFLPALRVLWRYRWNTLRGGLIGILVGALPGAGADIAAWLAYGAAKRFSKEPEKFGQGAMEPIVDAGVANNSALGAAWVPALVFGIPGDSVTAIAIGILMMKGLRPGPAIFQDYTSVLFAIYAVFILANVLMVPFGWLAIRASSTVMRVPRNVLMPVILLMCIVGSYAISNNPFDVGLMLVMGVLGFTLEKYGFPVAPVVLGLVLGPMVEKSFMTSVIISRWDLLAFFARPVSTVLGVLTILVWLLPVLTWARRRWTAPALSAEPVTPNVEGGK